MADRITLADYYYTMVPDKPGEGARVLGALRDAGVNLLAFSAFPHARRAQVDLVPSDPAAFLAAARAARIKLSRRKSVFLIDGEDRVGALAEVMTKLGAAKINVTATDAVCTGGGWGGGGRYGALLWVKSRDVKRAAQALGVTAS